MEKIRFHPIVAALLTPVLLAVLIASSTAQAANDRLFSSFARTILQTLNAAPVDSLPATNGYGAPRIAVRTVGAETPEIAANYTRQLLLALQKQAKGRFAFVALDSLDRLILDIKAEGTPTPEATARIRNLRVNARADVLVAGTVRRKNGETRLSYQAINTETGALLASTASRLVYTSSRPAPRIEPPNIEPPNIEPRKKTASHQSGYRTTVQEAEQMLFDKGYDPGPIDGHLTSETRAALRRYQQDSAMPMNGRLTRRVVNNLRRDTRAIVF
ncbi:MAG: peptidoglycan-binding protein [Alphaproteobacteria bacterium]|nr:peptidoglycan-binding protein [Alphaproteobacteria bacterium]